jgi:ankyrin repeat protein
VFNTPIIVAVQTGNMEAVRLLRPGACEHTVCLTRLHCPLVIWTYTGYQGSYQMKLVVPFALAIEFGYPDIFKLLLEGIDAAILNEAGPCALILAARLGDSESCEALLDSGVNVNGTSEYFEDLPTALMSAAAYGHLALVQRFLALGAIDVVCADSLCALGLAAQFGHVDIVELLLTFGAQLEPESTSGITPLMAAAMGGQEGTVKALLAAGANVNAANCNGTTPLLFAAYGDNTRVAEILIDAGADLHAVCAESGFWLQAPRGSNALDIAVLGSHVSMVQLLLQRGVKERTVGRPKGNTLFMTAVQAANDLQLVTFLLQRGVEINATNHRGQTALFMLFLSTSPGKLTEDDARAMLSLLISYGADIHARDQEGRTAVMHVWERNWCCTPQLIELGGMHDVDIFGNTALLACIQSMYRIRKAFDMLLAAGANPSTPNYFGTSPLLRAVSRGVSNRIVVSELLQAGADVNHVDRHACTALLLADPVGVYKSEDKDFLRPLVHAGVPINHVAHDGTTALIRFARQGLVESVFVMLAAGATFTDTFDNDDEEPHEGSDDDSESSSDSDGESDDDGSNGDDDSSSYYSND